MATTTGETHPPGADASARPARRGALGHTKRTKDAGQARKATRLQTAERPVTVSRGARSAKARASESFLHGLRQVAERLEKNIRAAERALPAAADAQLREDFEIIVHTVNKLGHRLHLQPVAPEAPTVRKPPARPTAPAKVATATPGRGAPVLGSNEEMIKQAHLLDAQAFQSLMGWSTRQALSKAVVTNRIFFVTHRAERYYPAFYGDNAYEPKHLAAVSQILGDLPGGSKLQFFLTPKRSLDGNTPLQALAHGRFAKVKDIASGFAEVPTPGG